MNKEQIHDEQISPLVNKIIEICQANGIAMICSFHIPNEDDDELLCTTALLDENKTAPEEFKHALNIIHPQPITVSIIVS